MPLPAEGLVHAHASPTAATPVATGRPSTTNRRYRSRIPAVVSTSLMGSPSTQCACKGQARITSVNRSGSRRGRRSVSDAAAQRVTDHVPLSPGIVSTEMVPSSQTGGPT
jgi:hypothetical protein